jgi:hypothetical protein
MSLSILGHSSGRKLQDQVQLIIISADSIEGERESQSLLVTGTRFR